MRVSDAVERDEAETRSVEVTALVAREVNDADGDASGLRDGEVVS